MNRAAVAQAELAIKTTNVSSDIIIIQEPVTYKHKLIQIPPSFEGFPSRTLDIRPRAAIYARKKLKLIELDSLQSADCAVVLAKISGRQTVIVSCYLDYNSQDVIPNELLNVCQYATQNKFPLLIGMDTNAHSTLYGPTTNKRGEKVEEFILSNHLNVENKGDIPTFQSSRYSTFIDVTLTRGFALVDNWRVDQSFNGSDHNTLLYSIRHTMEEVPSTRPWAKANWNNFTKSLSQTNLNFPETISDKKLEQQVTKLYRAINNALDTACPMTKATQRDIVNPWFTQEIKDMQEEVHNAYDAWKNGGRTADL